MREIGVRELRDNLSRTLHAVSRGERIRVKRHGRVLAELVPAGEPQDEEIRSLTAAGRLTPPSRVKPRRAPRLVEARQPASRFVLDERDER